MYSVFIFSVVMASLRAKSGFGFLKLTKSLYCVCAISKISMEYTHSCSKLTPLRHLSLGNVRKRLIYHCF